MVSTCWRKCVSKDRIFVVKFGVSILLSALAFMFVYNTTSVSDTPFLENTHISTSILSSQANPHQFPAQENGINNGGGKCDIFTGDWVPKEAPPLYNQSCSFITDHQNCIKNGRVDSDYLNWRWKPRGCELTQFDPARFLELMRNKRWAFIGDSISRNHAQSFLCLLSTVEKDVSLLHHDDKYMSQTWLFPFHNFTVFIIWSPFLAKAVIPSDLDTASSPEIQLHLDKLDQIWTEQYKSWDYVIFSSGKWFTRSAIYYENDTIVGSHYAPKRNLTELGFDFAYTRVLRKVLGYITSSNHKGTSFYRTTSPDHFEGGEWHNGGVCKRKVPAKEGEFELNLLDKILRDIEVDEFHKISLHGVNLRLFDVNPMSLLRADGHPGLVDGALVIYDSTDPASSTFICTSRFKAEESSILKVVWVPPEYGDAVACISDDGTLSLWEEVAQDTEGHQWKLCKRFDGNTSKVLDVQFGDSQACLKLVAAYSDGQVKVYELLDTLELERWQLQAEFQNVIDMVSKFGNASCLSASVSWNPLRSEVRQSSFVLGFSSNTAALNSAKIWEFDLDHQRWLPVAELSLPEEKGDVVHAVAWAPNIGRPYELIAVATQKGISIWHLGSNPDRDGRLSTDRVALLSVQDSEVWEMEWDMSGMTLATTGSDEVVRLWQSNLNGEWHEQAVLAPES